jgi:Flp pilus assembly protein TadD
MKQLVGFVLVVLLASLSGGRADDLDDQYIQVFNLIQEADKLSADLPNQALSKYLQAQALLQKLQQADPKWNSAVVGFRLNYVQGQIATLATKVPMPVLPGADTNAPPSAPPLSVSLTTPPTKPSKPAAPSNSDQQLSELKERVRLLQEDKGLLEAKLKEALAMQPAAVDPGELAKAQARIQSLQKENELLKASVDREKSKPAPVADAKAVELAQLALTEQKDQTTKLTLERDALQSRLKTLATQTEADNQLLKKQISELQAGNQALKPDAQAAAALRAENQLIKKELADIQASAAANSNKANESARQLAQAQAQIAALQSDNEILRLEKTAVEERYKQLSLNTSAAAIPASASAGDANRLKALERERDDLQKKLDAANKELYSRKSKGAAARVGELEDQLSAVRARLAVVEAKVVPYSTEELALLQTPQTKLNTQHVINQKKPLSELPAGSKELVIAAQRYFSAHQYDKAEEAYTKVLRQDKKSTPALANLAMIQVEAGHFEAAESNLKQALALAPEDPYLIYVQGLLKFRQKKYDDALDAFSRAAKLEPENAEVQTYLGSVLSEKGLRGPAETALRRAVELEPNYGLAHKNLAVFYITQKPSYPALAKWHYQKALAAGSQANPELEKLLEGKE